VPSWQIGALTELVALVQQERGRACCPAFDFALHGVEDGGSRGSA
jgi:hypothetical protein